MALEQQRILNRIGFVFPTPGTASLELQYTDVIVDTDTGETLVSRYYRAAYDPANVPDGAPAEAVAAAAAFAAFVAAS